MNLKVLGALAIAASSCTLTIPLPKEPIFEQTPLPNCAMTKKKIKLISLGEVELPMTGHVVMESLYVTKQEWKGHWPTSSSDGMTEHVVRACHILKTSYKQFFPKLSDDCREIYHGDARVWTPREGGGNYGQGVGDAFDALESMWEVNQYFAKGFLPAPGRRYIVINKSNGKAVVLAAGHEVGPASKNLVAGITPEPAYYLEKHDDTVFTVGEAADQTLPLGPIVCSNH